MSASGSVTFYDTYVTGNQGQVTLGSVELPAIAPNGTATVEYLWMLDSLKPYYHLIQVTAAKDPSETYTDNNSATHHIVQEGQPAAGNVNVDILNLNVSNQQQKYIGTASPSRGKLNTIGRTVISCRSWAGKSRSGWETRPLKPPPARTAGSTRKSSCPWRRPVML